MKPSSRVRATRAAFVGLIACSPVAVMAWMGCSSSASDNGPGPVDPGDTFGAEVTIHVVGSGRVQSVPYGVDCPTTCFRRFILDRNSDAAKTGVTLSVEEVRNWKFSGWSFNTRDSATAGKGPEACQPYTRATAGAPPGDTAQPTIVLPAGEVPGKPPAGHEIECAQSNVPIAYDVVANFVYAPVPDAGPDAGDAGDAGTEGEIVYDTPSSNAIGRGIFYRSRLFWQWDANGQSAISAGSTFPGSSRQDVVGPGTLINTFRVDYYGVYQNQALTLGTISTSALTVTNQPSPPTCTAVASDFSYVYCRTSGNPSTIVRWTSSGTGPTTIATGLPGGADLAVDSSSLYYSDSVAGAVYAIPVSGISDAGAPDAGGGNATLIASSQVNVSQVQVYSSNVYWVTNDGFGTQSIASASRFGGGSVTTLASRAGIKTVALDTSSGAYVFYTVVPSSAAGASSIYRVPMSGGSSTLVRQGLTSPGGVTADSSYVYWTGADGRVYRYTKF